jgi:hypothetical protein
VTGDVLAGQRAALGPDEVPLNYLTTLGRPAQADLDMLSRLKMPIKALSSTL